MSGFDYWNSGSTAYSKIMEAKAELVSSGLSPALLELVFLKISQINGCSYCIALHCKAALRAGVSETQIKQVRFTNLSDEFSELERAAISWAESVTTLTDVANVSAKREAIASMITLRQLTDLTVAIGIMNALNRLSIALGNPVGANI
ncbi:MAG: carboxymuconolactone decarboxylase family protein [Paracoccaceae bacterium]|nr:carboxymuconolactone decarboxylase family protein [Paracoccaceae bacterium]